jgi:Icc-related predicted phosphoesterase
VSCGDLPFDYLEYVVSLADVPLLYVPGNHDPSLRPVDTTFSPLLVEPVRPGPAGCDNIDGRVVEMAGLHVAGLGGCLRYREGANQYTQAQMRRRVLSIEVRVRLKRVRRGRKLDVVVTHAPPYGTSTAVDAAHVGFVSFHQLIRDQRPQLLVHGHVHPYGRVQPERDLDGTRIVNAVPSRLVELGAEAPR